ncbi:ATP-binding protein [Sphaerisporangium sp. B11E5]|uniref:ATP-binding protein n=1 Tax=Sphaerisporangium sp. B11E5 TaxID=3153563 RepID=UPI00325C6F30
MRGTAVVVPVCWDLSDDPSAIGKTRAMVKEVLTAWSLLTLTDDVILPVGELLANAVTHGHPPISLSLWLTPSDLYLHVTDRAPDPLRHLNLGPEAVHGRGLTIIYESVGSPRRRSSARSGAEVSFPCCASYRQQHGNYGAGPAAHLPISVPG